MPVPNFTAGEILTANAMNQIGLFLVKSQNVTGTPTSTVISSAFSSTYDHYRIVISNLAVSTSGQLRMTLGSQTSQYYYANPLTTVAGGAYNFNTGNNAAFFDLGATQSAFTNDFNFDIMSPFVASRTKINGFGYSNSTSFGGLGSGLVDVNTSFTAFTITCSVGTMSAGTIQVFGYRKP